MPMLTPARSCSDACLRLTTREPTAFIDLTDQLNRVVAEAGVTTGVLNVQTSHTTTAIVVNEFEPLLLQDFQDVLDRIAPRFALYGHDQFSRRGGVPAGERRNGHAHCRALFLPTSACLNIVGGRIALGRWQRILFLELDGPRERDVTVVVLGVAAL